MEKLITGPLADILKKNRGRFNTQFAYARQNRPSLDGEMLAYYLWDVAMPAINELDVRNSKVIEQTGVAFFEHILNLLQIGLLGSHAKLPGFENSWKNSILNLTELIELNPGLVLNKLTNALVNICSIPGARPVEWTERMIKLKSLTGDWNAYEKIGFISAWQSGMAHYRNHALQVAAELSDAALRQIFFPDNNLMPDKSVWLNELISHPWRQPSPASRSGMEPKKLSLVAVTGGFTGFGGPFISPPLLSASADGIIAHSEKRSWQVHADIYGQVLLAADTAGPGKNKPACPFAYFRNGLITINDLQTFQPELEDAFSCAGNEHTFAVTSRFSHNIYLFAAVES